MLNNWVWANLLPDIGKPYINLEETNDTIIRMFPSWVKPKKFKWHMDDEDRVIEALYPNNWEFQLEDELPVPLNKPIFIKKHQWHRLIKGTDSLYIKITKK